MPFQSTHPARGATGLAAVVNPDGSYFNPRTPRGVRLTHSFSSDGSSGFQSKHPARGATCSYCKHGPINGDFNPRTPRGVRRATTDQGMTPRTISIHAPREGCDGWLLRSSVGSALFQSTHPARGATASAVVIKFPVCHFNPHTPRGVRRPGCYPCKRPRHFNPHTPRGVRRSERTSGSKRSTFQSTHPARGATSALPVKAKVRDISIHTPREGCDSSMASR